MAFHRRSTSLVPDPAEDTVVTSSYRSAPPSPIPEIGHFLEQRSSHPAGFLSVLRTYLRSSLNIILFLGFGLTIILIWTHPSHKLDPSLFGIQRPASIPFYERFNRSPASLEQTDGPRWIRELHRDKIAILQVDNRNLSSLAEVSTLSDSPFYVGAAYANMFYAWQHGYKYLRQYPKPYAWEQEHHVTWLKVPAIRKALEHHELVVFLDSDALFYDQNFTIEHLLERYNVTEDTALVASTDFWPQAHAINTGFLIFRNHPAAFEMLDKLTTCVEDVEACGAYAVDPYHEQSALNHILWPQNQHWDNHIVMAPCDETLGGPAAPCHGTIIRHECGFFQGHSLKDDISADVSALFAQSMFKLVRNMFQSMAHST